MRPAEFRALERAVGGAERQFDHAGHAQGHGQLGREALHAAVQADVPGPLREFEQPVDAVLEILGIPEMPTSSIMMSCMALRRSKQFSLPLRQEMMSSMVLATSLRAPLTGSVLNTLSEPLRYSTILLPM